MTMQTTKTYSVEMATALDQPALAYWTFTDLEKARRFYRQLKRGMTDHTIILSLADDDGHSFIESSELGTGGRQAEPERQQVDYRVMLKQSSSYGCMTTGSEDFLLID